MRADHAPLILSVETATLAGSVALSEGGRLLSLVRGEERASHSEFLLERIDSVLKEAGRRLRDVDLFAAASGPGSFTGLRIGLATVKSFSNTLSRPCVGIPSLEAVAHSAGASSRTLAALPAGRGELFCQLFYVSGEGRVQSFDEPQHVPPGKLLERLSGIRPLLWAGEGAHHYSELIEEFASRNGIIFSREDCAGEGAAAEWALAPRVVALAGSVAALAWQRYLQDDVHDAEGLKAIYVRPSDAEIKKV